MAKPFRAKPAGGTKASCFMAKSTLRVKPERAAPEKVRPIRRKASRDERRKQFIEATITTIARTGYARATLTDVARTAGLSHGLVIFHFGTKEALFVETLLYLAGEYRDNWVNALAEAAPDPAAQLEALIRADFNDAICDHDRLAAWSAFWGESQNRPLYLQECAANDEEYNRTIEDLCSALVRDGGYRHDPAIVARAIRILLEGLWLDLVTRNRDASRQEAMATALTTVHAFFPDHFPAVAGPA